MQRIAATLKETGGVLEKDMQTLNVRLSPVFGYEAKTNKRFKEGYLVQQDLQVKIRDPSQLSRLMEIAVGAG